MPWNPGRSCEMSLKLRQLVGFPGRVDLPDKREAGGGSCARLRRCSLGKAQIHPGPYFQVHQPCDSNRTQVEIISELSPSLEQDHWCAPLTVPAGTVSADIRAGASPA
jgi:hypothetical protein